MKNLKQNEAISLVAALLVIGFVFFGSFANPFKQVVQTEVAPKDDAGAVTLVDSATQPATAAEALRTATDDSGEITKLVIEDVKKGEGELVEKGDVVTVHYTGVLKDGTKFDDSRVRGTPFTFTVGVGEVIKGWDQGVVGMRVGGERVLVIPSELGYGNRQLGPIPPNSTLLFSIVVLEVK